MIVEDKGVKARQCSDLYGGKRCQNYMWYHQIHFANFITRDSRRYAWQKNNIDDIRYLESKVLACRELYTRDLSMDQIQLTHFNWLYKNLESRIK